jgi:hypothetical protein
MGARGRTTRARTEALFLQLVDEELERTPDDDAEVPARNRVPQQIARELELRFECCICRELHPVSAGRQRLEAGRRRAQRWRRWSRRLGRRRNAW